MIQPNHDAIYAEPPPNVSKDECRVRVKEIFQRYLRIHAHTCRDAYPDKFNDLIKTADAEMLKRVAGLTDKHITEASDNDVDKLKLVATSDYKFDAKYTYNMLESLLKKTPEKKLIELNRYCGLDETQSRSVYEDYLLTPCKGYKQLFGSKLFELVNIEKDYVKPVSIHQPFYLG